MTESPSTGCWKRPPPRFREVEPEPLQEILWVVEVEPGQSCPGLVNQAHILDARVLNRPGRCLPARHCGAQPEDGDVNAAMLVAGGDVVLPEPRKLALELCREEAYGAGLPGRRLRAGRWLPCGGRCRCPLLRLSMGRGRQLAGVPARLALLDAEPSAVWAPSSAMLTRVAPSVSAPLMDAQSPSRGSADWAAEVDS